MPILNQEQREKVQYVSAFAMTLCLFKFITTNELILISLISELLLSTSFEDYLFQLLPRFILISLIN